MNDAPIADPTRPEAHTPAPSARITRIALLGNPNTGKTTLFNRLTALRHKTANFSGTTQEYRVAPVAGRHARGWKGELIDLPGTYGLGVDQPEAALCRAVLDGSVEGFPPPDALCIVLDGSSLGRGLRLVGEAARCGLPMLVAVNMIDAARKRGVEIDTDKLASELGCPVVACSARTGQGVDALSHALEKPSVIRAASRSERVTGTNADTKTTPSRSWLVDPESARTWADDLAHQCTTVAHHPKRDALTERIDHIITHPVLGLVIFAAVMFALFWSVFKFAGLPMDWIDSAFAWMGGFVRTTLGDGAIASLLADGIIGGVGAAVIFLPQIVLLFFLIALLEGSGYLSRAALLMDRLFRPFGLPGQSFVPMLSAHACAIPAIMACRGVPGRAERLATILVAPFFSCSARIPVYALLVGLLFTSDSAKATGFALCYAVGAAAALFTAALFRRTILRGPRRLMAIDLPAYRRPSVRTALVTTFDASWAFLKNAGTVILAMMVVLWWLGAYPITAPPPEATALSAQAEAIAETDPQASAALTAEADELTARHASANSYMGRIGRTVQPVFAPLGYDWKLTVGVLGSFAAREVFVSTVAVVVAGSEDAEDAGVLDRIARAKRDDGSPMLTPATSWSLLIFFVLAMQCLPTLAVTAREAGGWKWALLQLVWMSGLAYVSALIVYQAMRAAGAG